ncbi:MAG: carbohydrate ABC transporter permease [Armatimonadota bacterium]
MPIIAHVGRKSWKVRLLTVFMYLILAVLGVTMAYPFLITATSSTTNAMDYQRFAPLPRSLWSREDRFVRAVVPYFPETLRNAVEQFNHLFVGVPSSWTTWQAVGKDTKGIDAFARSYLEISRDPVRWEQAQRMAADYADFSRQYPTKDSVCSVNEQNVAFFLRDHYEAQVPGHASTGERERQALARLSHAWGITYENFYRIRPYRELSLPWDQPNFWPPVDQQMTDFIALRQAYRDYMFIPGSIKAKWYRLLQSEETRETLGISGRLSVQAVNNALGTGYRSFDDMPFPVTLRDPQPLRKLWAQYNRTVMPASETRPFPLKTAWLRYLGAPAQREDLGLPAGGALTIEEYNKSFDTQYPSMRETPFPVPVQAPGKLREYWVNFVQKQYPLRLIEVRVTPELTNQYRAFVRKRFLGNLARCNDILGTSHTAWESVVLTPNMPWKSEQQSNLWMEFVAKLPFGTKIPRCAEIAYQQFLLKQYGNLAEVNRQYGCRFTHIEQAQMPFDMAYLVTFVHNERELYLSSVGRNYSFVTDYLVRRGRAIGNTIILIVLTLLAALTINPLAAYALSRFQMKQTPAIILFMLATMAFPAAVSMIPGFILMRDLHMLNSYWALILPGIASGMGIFLLKGFFDSLPPELYEAAALDGAKEWQLFLRITMPLSKPILAVIALNSFMAAYNSWEWALVVCQNPKMWTMAVWIYQFNSTWGTQPWAVMAAFVIGSLPVFLVFILCQNIILRGIILPQMK